MNISNLFKNYSHWLLCIALPLILFACKSKPVDHIASENIPKELKLSLAQWSIHRAIESGTLKAENFASIAKNDFGINAIEYVSSFYKDHATDERFWKIMRERADSLKVKSLLIMIDNEGDLGNSNSAERRKAVENHFKWVDAAKILGCHSIRINAFGEGTKEEVQTAMVDALQQLCKYALKDSIHVLIENHGLFSSDGQWIVEIMKRVNMPNVGTLPDFGNWCTSEKWGSTETEKKCVEQYDRYKGVVEMLPFAQGVSAKSYNFNSQGEDLIIDYSRMMKIVKESNFSGYIGIEYEGTVLSEKDGILATKKLLEKAW